MWRHESWSEFGRLVTVVACAGLGAALLPETARAQQQTPPQQQPPPPQQPQQQPKSIEIEGPVTRVSGTCPSLTMWLGAQQVTLQSDTEIDDGSCTDITNGRRVEVEGTLQSDGTALAREVDLD